MTGYAAIRAVFQLSLLLLPKHWLLELLFTWMCLRRKWYQNALATTIVYSPSLYLKKRCCNVSSSTIDDISHAINGEILTCFVWYFQGEDSIFHKSKDQYTSPSSWWCIIMHIHSSVFSIAHLFFFLDELLISSDLLLQLFCFTFKIDTFICKIQWIVVCLKKWQKKKKGKPK